MNPNITNKKQSPQEKKINWAGLFRTVLTFWKLITKVCCIGMIIGMVISFSIPKEYTADILIAPESTRRSSSSGMNALAEMADIDLGTSTTIERDAIYPSLYPIIVNSTPFLIRLFDVEVREQKGDAVMTLARYLQGHQKTPWWRIITSAPSRIMGWIMSLFKDMAEIKQENAEKKTDPFQLTRKESGIAAAIASRIKIGVDKKKRVITISVTMQDPLVAAIVADTVRVHLQEYVTEYRTNKARRNLEYMEQLRKEAQAEYYTAQKKYTGYADVNLRLSKLSSSAELVRLQNEMNLSHSTYNQMEQQVQVAKAKVEKITPVYAIIQPVQVPRTPSNPNKAMIIVGCMLLGGAGCLGWILFITKH